MIHKLSTGDKVHRYQKSIVVEFTGGRKVLSTSPFNGGYREDLKYVFNHDGNPGAGMACKMKAPTYAEHLNIIAQEIGLDPKVSAGISTAASMKNVAIKVTSFDEVTVTAIVTGGVEVNGGRVGDPASYVQKHGKTQMIKQGTINTILVIDADLPEGTLTRALITCTEAKTAVLQELMAGSNYSRGLATGSGTDGSIIICNSDSSIKLTDAGKHSKLGELIGIAVKKALKEALNLQSGLCPLSQHRVLRRMKRFGVNEDRIWIKYMELFKDEKEIKLLTKPKFMHNLDMLDGDDFLVTVSSLYAHMIDQMDWELLSKKEVIEECILILNRIETKFNIEKFLDSKMNFNDEHKNIDFVVEKLIELFTMVMAKIVGVREYV